MQIDPPRPLSPEHQQRLDDARNWIKGHFNDDPEQCYAPVEGKLHVIAAILTNNWIDPSETWKMQALGVAFGDALAQKLMLEWVSVEDEYGSDPALNWPGTLIHSYPMTMISKRVERDEEIDVKELFEATCHTLTDMAFSGKYI